ncbi:MAG: hypothetical protein ACRDRS_07920 [Pseudonocardiaceae bacterium]
MKRLLTLVMAVLLCVAGAGLASAEVAPSAHHSRAAQIPSAEQIPSAARLTLAAAPASPPGEQLTTAASVTQAMRAVLPSAKVSFEVYDRQTDTVLTSQNADQPGAAMSVVKLLIALGALDRDNWAAPDNATQQEIHQMLAASDDQIADSLWTVDGGPAIVTRMVSVLGLTGTRPPADPGEWGDTLITPQDMVTVYRFITDQLPNPDRDLVLGALADAPRIATDGTNQYFGIPDGMPHTTWAIKQGWGTSGSQAVMNSTGLVGTDSRYVVVLLASAPENAYSTLPAAVTAGAGALASLVGSAAS